MSLLLLLAALAAAPLPAPFAEPPPVEVWASEDWPATQLRDAARLPGARLGVSLRSNMLRPDAFALLQNLPALVRIVPGLVEAHVDQYRKLPKATIVLKVDGPLDATLARQLVKLGPQGLRIEIARIDSAVAESLALIKNAEVELDLRGRIPEQEELSAFVGLSRLRRAVRIRAVDSPALVGALQVAKPARIVVESADGSVPQEMAAALEEAGVPVRFAIGTQASPEALKRLGGLPRVSFELALGGEPQASLREARALLGALSVAR